MNLTPEVVVGLSVGASVVATLFVNCLCFCCQRGEVRSLKKQVDALQGRYNEFVTPVVSVPAPEPTPTAVVPPPFQNRYVVPIPSAPPTEYFQRSAVV
jgi:hypothetical protein